MLARSSSSRTRSIPQATAIAAREGWWRARRPVYSVARRQSAPARQRNPWGWDQKSISERGGAGRCRVLATAALCGRLDDDAIPFAILGTPFDAQGGGRKH